MADVIRMVLALKDEASAALRETGKAAGEAQDGMDGADAASVGLAGTLAAMTTVVVAAATAMFGLANSASEMVDGYLNFAATTGLATETVIGLEQAMMRGGASIDEARLGLTSFVGKMGQAAKGNAAMVQSFEDLGVSVTDVDGNLRDVDDVLRETLRSIQTMDSATERASAAVEVFGARGGKLVGVLGSEVDALDRYAQAATDAGFAIDEGSRKASADMDNALADLDLSLKAVTLSLGEAFTPTVVEAVGALAELIVAFNRAIPLLLEVGEGIKTVASPLSKLDDLWRALSATFESSNPDARAFSDTLEDIARNAGRASSALGDLGEGEVFGSQAVNRTTGSQARNAAAAKATRTETEALVAAVERLAGIKVGPTIDSLTASLDAAAVAGRVTAEEYLRLSDGIDAVKTSQDQASIAADFERETAAIGQAADVMAGFEAQMASLGVSLATPLSDLEQLNMVMADLTIAFSRGQITAEQFGSAVAAIDGASAGGGASTRGTAGATVNLGNLGALEQVFQAGMAAALTSPTALLALGGAYGQALAGILDTLAALGEKGTEAVMEGFQEFTADVLAGIKALPELIGDVLPSLLTDTLPALTEAIITAAPELAVAIAKSFAIQLFQYFAGLPMMIQTAMINSLTSWIRDIPSIVDSLREWFSGAWETVKQWFSDLFSFNVDGLLGDGPVGTLVESVGDLGSAIKDLVTGQFASGTDFVSKTGIALVHQGEAIVPRGGRSTQGAATRATQASAGGGTVNLTVNAMAIEHNAVDALVRQIEQRFRSVGGNSSGLFNSL